DAQSRESQRKAIKEQQWDAYSAQLLEQGIAYARMGLEFRDWSYIIKVYRDYAQPIVVERFQNDVFALTKVLEGLNKIIDYALNVIAESYFHEKNELIRQEQAKREEAMNKLQQSEARFRALFENSSDHIYMIDRNGVILYINHVADGLTKAEVEGTSLYDFQTPESRKKVEAAVAQVYQTGKPSVYEHQAHLPVGIKYYTSSVAPVFEGDQVIYVAVISRDDTERIMASKKLAELNESLEERVEERTQELQRINSELEGFTYTVSHDLRAPIRAIDGFTKVLIKSLEGKMSQQEKHYLNNVVESSARMGELIDDLLAFSRMGRREKLIGEYDMKQLVEQTYKELVQINDPSQTIHFDVSDLLNSLSDREMIKLVWSNLIGNAIKYSWGRNPIKIQITSIDLGEVVEYCIEDNGVGFEMEYVHKVFGIFQRLHDEEEFEGTGVGLAIVQRIVDRHGGSVRAESVLGQGARFYFSLPKYQTYE
ncbi:MAG: ATP-binding protein, partial [Marinoscillum sp.]